MAKYKSRKKKQSLLPIALGAVGAFVVLAVVATMLSTDEGTVYGDVSLEGDGLPVYTATASDSAVGLAFPEISGVGVLIDNGTPSPT